MAISKDLSTFSGYYKRCAVYMIKNVLNGNCYIGSTRNLGSRWSGHLSAMLKNKHHAIHLQRAVNEYGIKYFIFGIVEECDAEILVEREQYYMDKYRTTYNSSKTAKSPTTIGVPLSEEHKMKISNALKGKPKTKEHGRKVSEATKGKKKREGHWQNSVTVRQKQVVLYGLGTQFLFESITKAANFLGVFDTNLSVAIRNGRKYKNLYFKYAD